MQRSELLLCHSLRGFPGARLSVCALPSAKPHVVNPSWQPVGWNGHEMVCSGCPRKPFQCSVILHSLKLQTWPLLSYCLFTYTEAPFSFVQKYPFAQHCTDRWCPAMKCWFQSKIFCDSQARSIILPEFLDQIFLSWGRVWVVIRPIPESTSQGCGDTAT